MGDAYGTHGREFYIEFWWKNLKEDLEDLGAGRRITLQCILKKHDVRMWT
jgi:hypothetical protein